MIQFDVERGSRDLKHLMYLTINIAFMIFKLIFDIFVKCNILYIADLWIYWHDLRLGYL